MGTAPSLFQTPDEARAFLSAVGGLPEGAIDIGETALALGLCFLPGLRAERYRHHLSRLQDQTREDAAARLRAGDEDTPALRARCLRKILHEAHGYAVAGAADPDGANLPRAIDTRRASPALLAALYIVLAQGAGWAAEALSFPDHVLVRLDHAGQRVILDPALEGREMDAHGLRDLLKSIAGAEAELNHAYYAPLSDRALLARLQNGLKARYAAVEDYARALQAVETIGLIAPAEARPLFDKGVLYVKMGQGAAAVDPLEAYVRAADDPQAAQDARALLRMIREGLV